MCWQNVINWDVVPEAVAFEIIANKPITGPRAHHQPAQDPFVTAHDIRISAQRRAAIGLDHKSGFCQLYNGVVTASRNNPEG